MGPDTPIAIRRPRTAAAPAPPPPAEPPVWEAPARPADAAAAQADEGYRLHRRFDRMARLVGDGGMRRLLGAHEMVVGQGGVGSWAAESLVRSGVGRLSIVDFDLVCVTNTNRQLHALKGTTGKVKVEVMAERLRAIHPRCDVHALAQFYNADSSRALLDDGPGGRPDVVIDAIDNLTAKAHLIAACRERGIALVVSGGASGRMDPTQILRADLAHVEGDPFLAQVRKMLRANYGFPKGSPRLAADSEAWGITAVHSLEPAADPLELEYDEGTGFVCVCPQGNNGLHGCDHRNVIYGTASFVTGAFGLACAAAAVERLTSV